VIQPYYYRRPSPPYPRPSPPTNNYDNFWKAWFISKTNNNNNNQKHTHTTHIIREQDKRVGKGYTTLVRRSGNGVNVINNGLNVFSDERVEDQVDDVDFEEQDFNGVFDD
jgi:hypothetical protein